MSDHLIAEANRHAKALPKGKMTLPTTKPNDRDLAWYIEECIDLQKQLDREVESKNAHLRIACDEINQLKVRIGFFEREICRLRADNERMDWLARNRSVSTIERPLFVTPESLRAAIDAARKEQP
jgi:hypothetical protein